MLEQHLIEECAKILQERDPGRKLKSLFNLHQSYLSSSPQIEIKPTQSLCVEAGFPERLNWVHPKHLVQRKLSQLEGRMALMHAVSHIEFNAINLALDAMCRFANLPEAFYRDWFKVAVEEAYHFHLLQQYMQHHNYEYGDLPVHNGLWTMAQDTAYDPMVRMACVPRLLEARGLDVAPQMAAKLAKNGDQVAAEILGIIFQDEIDHVRIGNRWYHYFCQQRKIDPIQTFRTLVKKHAPEFLRGPYNTLARLEAGFLDQEIQLIEEMSLNS